MQQWHELETLKGYSLQARRRRASARSPTSGSTTTAGRCVTWWYAPAAGCWGARCLLAPSVVRGVNAAREQIAVDLTRRSGRERARPSTPNSRCRATTNPSCTTTTAGRRTGWAALLVPWAPWAPTPRRRPSHAGRCPNRPEPHLRSSGEVRGYGMHALDGEIGEVVDFVVHEEDWTIRYLVADTRKWLPGRKVLLAPSWVLAIRWADREIAIDMERDTMRTAPAYEGPQAIDKVYEVQLYQHYGVALGHAHAETA